MSGKQTAQVTENFSEREMEILRLIKAGLSNQAISQKLFLSIETIKWYNHQIFGKLGVESRTQAIDKALALGLLDQRAEAPPRVSDRPRHNLAMELTSLVGRESDLAEIARLLHLNTTRLLTLTGAGGCGKTRLALRTGRNLIEHFPQGAWWVELAPLSDPAQVSPAVVSALGLVVSAGHSPEEALTAFLRERLGNLRFPMLLILDNCEHLLDGVSRLVVDLLSTCPGLQILATSREPLAAPGEFTYRVPSLALPPEDTGGSIEAYAAAQLFLERARSILPGYSLAEGEERALARICRRLDGIPLAIELAAARVSVLPVTEIANRLEDGFRVLGSGSRASSPRHATLHATVAWSYDLLPVREQVLLRRLPLFAGGWTLEQAEEVCPADELEQEEVLDRLAALVSKSLVIAERLSTPGGTMRYRLHEMVRQFARERLVEAGEEDALRGRFLDCYLRLVEAAEPGLKGPRQMEWLARLDQERDNLTEAISSAVAHRDVRTALRLSGGLAHYWNLRGRLEEGRRWLEAAIALQGAIPVPDVAEAHALTDAQADALRARAKALTGLFVLGDYPLYTQRAGLDSMRECQQLYRVLGDRRGLAYLYIFLPVFSPADRVDRLAELRAILPDVLAAGDHWTAAYVLRNMALFDFVSSERDPGTIPDWEVYTKEFLIQMRLAEDRISLAMLEVESSWNNWNQGHVHQARDMVSETLRVFDEAGLTVAKFGAYFNLAFFEAALGNFAAANICINEGQQIIRECGDFWFLPSGMQAWGRIFFLEGRLAEARAALERALASPENVETTRGTGYQLLWMGLILLYENQPEPAAQLLSHSLAIIERDADHTSLHEPLRELGRVRLAQGNLPAARDLLYRSLEEITRNHTLPESPELLDLLAQLALAEGNATQAARLLGAADGLLRRMDMVRYPIYRPEYKRCRAAAFAAVGEVAFAAAYAEGEGISAGQRPIEAIHAMMER